MPISQSPSFNQEPETTGVWLRIKQFFSWLFSPFTRIFNALFSKPEVPNNVVLPAIIPVRFTPVVLAPSVSSSKPVSAGPVASSKPLVGSPFVKPLSRAARAVFEPVLPPAPISGNPILFYDRNQPYYHFTNFAHSLMIIDGFSYPTAEHYFQSKKFENVAIWQVIRQAAFPGEALQLANGRYGAHIRPNWHNGLSNHYMLEAQLYKYSQNPHLLKELLATGNRPLIEDAGPRDATWGNGLKGSTTDSHGENRLGKILMGVRSAFRKALEENNTKQKIVVTLKGNKTITDGSTDLKDFGFDLPGFLGLSQRASPGASR